MTARMASSPRCATSERISGLVRKFTRTSRSAASVPPAAAGPGLLEEEPPSVRASAAATVLNTAPRRPKLPARVLSSLYTADNSCDASRISTAPPASSPARMPLPRIVFSPPAVPPAPRSRRVGAVMSTASVRSRRGPVHPGCAARHAAIRRACSARRASRSAGVSGRPPRAQGGQPDGPMHPVHLRE